METGDHLIDAIEYSDPNMDAKSCPFCGNKEVKIAQYKRKDISADNERHLIFCTNCLATIDPGWVQQKSTVIEMWNKRVQKGEQNDITGI